MIEFILEIQIARYSWMYLNTFDESYFGWNVLIIPYKRENVLNSYRIFSFDINNTYIHYNVYILNYRFQYHKNHVRVIFNSMLWSH